MFNDFIVQIQYFLQQSSFYLKPWCEVIGILWLINIGNWLTGSYLNIFGILPRRLFGLIGILFAPILHDGFRHLFFNTIPLFVLGIALLATEGTVNFIWITLVIVVLSGLAVWLIARQGVHIGASGLISGYFSYILVTAYQHPSAIDVIIAGLAFYYFGGILLGLLPMKKKVSWEAHLCGFLAGIACVYLPNELWRFVS